jgi:hypothetical protein
VCSSDLVKVSQFLQEPYILQKRRSALPSGHNVLVVGDWCAGIRGEFFLFLHKKPPFVFVRLDFNCYHIPVNNHLHLITEKIVSIPRQSRGLYDCWPLKGA